MSSLALLEVQRALYQKLVGDGVLMGMVGGVYDVVPQKTALPYIMIGNGRETLRPVDGLTLTECRFELHVATEAGGRKSALAILNRLHALIHLGTLTLSGFQLVTLRVAQASTMLTEEGTEVTGKLGVEIAVVEN